MPQEQNLKKRIPDVILDLFRDNFKDGPFHAYRVGDPIIMPESMLPALLILEPSTHYEVGPTGFDDITHRLLLKVVYNKKDDFGNPNPNASVDLLLDDIVQGRDATTGEFLPQTIMGVLRKNFTLGNLVVNQIGDVEKDVVQRSETLLTAEVYVRIEVEELQQVSSRV